MIKGITFENQNVTSAADANLHKRLFAADGILTGCAMSVTQDTLNIQPGYMLISGRLIQFDGITSVTFEDPIINGYGRVSLIIDLSVEASPDDFQQARLSVDYSGTTTFQTLLANEDINNGGTLYQAELALVQITNKNITGITRNIGSLSINADSLGGKTESQLNVANATKLNNKAESALSVKSATTANTATNATKLNNKAESALSVARAKLASGIASSGTDNSNTNPLFDTFTSKLVAVFRSPQNITTIQFDKIINNTWAALELNAAAFKQVSSIEGKENITDYKGALDKIAGLKVYEYDRKGTGTHQIGLIIEDKSTPDELVSNYTSDENMAAIDLYSLICMFIQAFKEQREINERLETEIQLALAELAEIVAGGDR